MWTWTCYACGKTFTAPMANAAEAMFNEHAREAHRATFVLSATVPEPADSGATPSQ